MKPMKPIQTDQRLKFLVKQEYADLIKELTGKFPKFVPCSGTYPNGRGWIRYNLP